MRDLRDRRCDLGEYGRGRLRSGQGQPRSRRKDPAGAAELHVRGALRDLAADLRTGSCPASPGGLVGVLAANWPGAVEPTALH